MTGGFNFAATANLTPLGNPSPNAMFSVGQPTGTARRRPVAGRRYR